MALSLVLISVLGCYMPPGFIIFHNLMYESEYVLLRRDVVSTCTDAFYRSHFQKYAEYAGSSEPPPKSWSAPVMRSVAMPQPASK